MKTVHIDRADFDRMINRMSVLARKDVPVLVKQSARRVAVNLARATVPFGFDESARLSGVKQASGDVWRAFKTPAAVAEKLDEDQRGQFAYLLANGRPAQINKFLQSVGESGLSYSKTAKASEHKRVRGRSGRVSQRHEAKVLTLNESIGKLADRVVRRVGLAKFGWAMAARALGGVRGIPKWVSISKGPGSTQAGTATQVRTGSDPSYRLTNRIPYVSRLLPQNQIMLSLKREQDFLIQEIQRRVARSR